MEGLWTAEFGSSAGIFGGGVAVFMNGKIFGGDATHYYVGEYALKGDTFTARLKVSPFIEGALSVFNTVGRELTLQLTGLVTPDGRATAHGHSVGIPQLSFGVKLTKRA